MVRTTGVELVDDLRGGRADEQRAEPKDVVDPLRLAGDLSELYRQGAGNVRLRSARASLALGLRRAG